MIVVENMVAYFIANLGQCVDSSVVSRGCWGGVGDVFEGCMYGV